MKIVSATTKQTKLNLISAAAAASMFCVFEMNNKLRLRLRLRLFVWLLIVLQKAVATKRAALLNQSSLELTSYIIKPIHSIYTSFVWLNIYRTRTSNFDMLLLNLGNTFLCMVNTYIIVPATNDYSMSLGTVCGVVEWFDGKLTNFNASN